jgi:hypothetical protein
LDFIVIALSFFAIVVVLKIMKSAFKFVLTAAIFLFIAYYLDIMGIIDISPVLDALGI